MRATKKKELALNSNPYVYEFELDQSPIMNNASTGYKGALLVNLFMGVNMTQYLNKITNPPT